MVGFFFFLFTAGYFCGRSLGSFFTRNNLAALPATHSNPTSSPASCKIFLSLFREEENCILYRLLPGAFFEGLASKFGIISPVHFSTNTKWHLPPPPLPPLKIYFILCIEEEWMMVGAQRKRQNFFSFFGVVVGGGGSGGRRGKATTTTNNATGC